MKVPLPPLSIRREIDRCLISFYRGYRKSDFNKALRLLCRFYDITPPKVVWYERIDFGATAGKTFQNGMVWLTHPENWKAKSHSLIRTERNWISLVHHELHHYLFWSKAEDKANEFSRQMTRGLHNG